MNKAGYLLAFSLGAVVGAFGTWQYAKAQSEKRAQEEIEAVKADYFRKKKEKHVTKEAPTANEEDETLEEQKLRKKYNNIIKENGYIAKSESNKDQKSKKTYSMGAYVIPPEEYGEFEDYETISLIYYADGILTDDDDEPIDNEEETVGVNWSEHFGEYEDDSVYLRNDERKCDYEILRDNRRYSEVLRR